MLTFGTPSTIGSHSGKKPLTMMNIIIFWMCVVDGFHMIPIIVNWIPQMIPESVNNGWFFNPTECTIIGVVAQFCCIQSPLWHILLAYHLGIYHMSVCYTYIFYILYILKSTGYLLCGGSLEKLAKQKHFHYALVILIPLIATIIPAFMPENNGYQENQMDLDKDCWVVGASQYIFMSCISLSLAVHYMVLLVAVYQFKKYKEFVAFSFQYYQIVIKLSRFVFVYTLVRLFPLIERIWEAIGGVPYWLVLLQHLSIALLGLTNAIVWFWNQQNDKIPPFRQQYNERVAQYNNQQQNQHYGQYARGQQRVVQNGTTDTNQFNGSTLRSTTQNAQFGDTLQDNHEQSLETTETRTITTLGTEPQGNQPQAVNVIQYNNHITKVQKCDHDSNTEVYGNV